MGDFDVEDADLDRYMTGDRQLLMGRWNTSVHMGVDVDVRADDRSFDAETRMDNADNM